MWLIIILGWLRHWHRTRPLCWPIMRNLLTALIILLTIMDENIKCEVFSFTYASNFLEFLQIGKFCSWNRAVFKTFKLINSFLLWAPIIFMLIIKRVRINALKYAYRLSTNPNGYRKWFNLVSTPARSPRPLSQHISKALLSFSSLYRHRSAWTRHPRRTLVLRTA